MEELGSILEQVTRSLWTTTLGLALDRVPGDPEPVWTEAPLVAATSLSGDWNGRVTLSCSRGLVRRVARVFFGPDPLELQRVDLEDALGEMVNMTAGNVKACLGASSRLSLPVPGPREAPLGEALAVRRSFLCEGEPVVLEIFGGRTSRRTS